MLELCHELRSSFVNWIITKQVFHLKDCHEPLEVYYSFFRHACL